jgi:hypothetical protein
MSAHLEGRLANLTTEIARNANPRHSSQLSITASAIARSVITRQCRSRGVGAFDVRRSSWPKACSVRIAPTPQTAAREPLGGAADVSCSRSSASCYRPDKREFAPCYYPLATLAGFRRNDWNEKSFSRLGRPERRDSPVSSLFNRPFRAIIDEKAAGAVQPNACSVRIAQLPIIRPPAERRPRA